MRQLIYIKTSDIAKALNIEPKQATKIKQLINGTLDPFEVEGVTGGKGFYDTCPEYYLILGAINEIIKGFGVEVIDGEWVDSYHQNFTHDYVNTGDAYNTTVIRDNRTGNFYLGCYGDFVEGC